MNGRISTAKERYLGLSKVKKATIWITLCSFLQRGLAFITVPIFTRLLSTAEYGSVNVYQSWEMVAMYLATLGITYGGFNNGMIRFKDDKEGYTTSIVGLIIILGLLWLILCEILADRVVALSGMSLTLVSLLFIEVIVKGIYDVWVSRMKYDFEYRKLVIASLLLTITVPILGIIFVVLASDKVLARILSFILVETAFALVLGTAIFRRSKRLFKWEYWKFTLLFNIPLLPHYLSQVVLSSCDRIMIDNLCSAADVGIYSIAYSAGMIMTVLTNSLNSTVVPWLYRTLESKGYDRIGRMSFLLLLSISISIFVVDALAPELVAILAPSEYNQAIMLVPIIAASVFFMFLYSYCSNIEFYFEKTFFATLASVTAAILNIVLNALLIPIFGYQTAGYTTLICYMAMGFAHYIFAQYIAKEEIGLKLLNTRVVWCLALIFVALSLLVSLLYPYPIARYIIFAFFIISLFAGRRRIIAKAKEFKG